MFKQVRLNDAILRFYQRSQPIAFSNAETLYDDLILLRDQILMYGDLSEAQTNYLNNFIDKFDNKLTSTTQEVLSKWVDDGILADLVRVAINDEVIESRDGETSLSVRLNRDKQYSETNINLLKEKDDQFTDQLEQIQNNKLDKNSLSKETLDLVRPDFKNKVIAKDNFFRPSSDIIGQSETGQVWENITSLGYMKVGGNALQGATDEVDIAVIESGLSDCEISVSMRDYAVGDGGGIVFRLTDKFNYWYVSTELFEGQRYLSLYKFEDSVLTHGKRSMLTANNIEGANVRVVLSGLNIQVYVEQTLYINHTTSSAFNLSATKHGLVSFLKNRTIFNRFRILETGDSIENYPDTLIASVDNMLVNYVGTTLMLSRNGGLSYTESLNIADVEIIKYIHLFGDGRIMFADHQNVYYSHDWKTYHKAQVFNEDGSIYTPDTYDNFSCYKNGTVKKIVDGIELVVWGNYSTEPSVEYTSKVKTWYSADYGKTVKCCYTFNTPQTLACRHIHNVDFNPSDKSFWLQTGDEKQGTTEMSHWVKGVYNVGADAWTWSRFASGANFKTTNMIFHENGYVYWSWDKTPGGVVKAPYSTLASVGTHQLIFETNKDCHFVIVGRQGDILALQTRDGGTDNARVMYYSPDGIDFNRIVGEMPFDFYQNSSSQYQAYWGLNFKGKILAGIQNVDTQSIRDWNRKPSIFIDDIIRESGFPNAFK